MESVKIGKRIRELREMQNYTRETLAEKIDISTKFLYEIEVGKRNFSAGTLSRIAKELSVSCDYILFGENTKHKGSEKILCVPEMLEPKQISKIQDILKLLSETPERID